MSDRRRHPQVIRAKELAREAGLDPHAKIEPRDRRHLWVYEQFMDAAFEEHFAREAVDNIYWDQRASFYTDRWNIPHRDGDCRLFYGRCKSGKRWFWYVGGWQFLADSAGKEHGWTDTEAQALIEGTAAIKRLAAGRRAIAYFSHGTASHALKQFNKDKRAAQWRPTDTNSKVIEYLYGHTIGGEDSAGYPVRFRITKKTAKRVYYLRKGEWIDTRGEPLDFGNLSADFADVIGYVNRQRLEANGEIYNNGVHWSADDHHLHASLQGLLDRFGRYQQKAPPDLRKLKAAMAAAHPDKGGSNAAFITARAAYETALRQAKSKPQPDHGPVSKAQPFATDVP